MERTSRFASVRLLAFAVLALLLVQGLWSRAQQAETIPYSRFEQLLREDKVQSVQISANEIRGQLRQPERGMQWFTTQRVDPELVFVGVGAARVLLCLKGRTWCRNATGCQAAGRPVRESGPTAGGARRLVRHARPRGRPRGPWSCSLAHPLLQQYSAMVCGHSGRRRHDHGLGSAERRDQSCKRCQEVTHAFHEAVHQHDVHKTGGS
jgi:hypothetical protein